MRYCIGIFIVAYMCGCSLQQSQESVIKTLVYIDVHRSVPKDKASLLFVDDSSEIAKEVARQLRQEEVTVREIRYCKWGANPTDCKTGKLGAVIGVRDVVIKADGTAECYAELIYGNLGGMNAKYCLRRKNGRWIIHTVTTLGIS